MLVNGETSRSHLISRQRTPGRQPRAPAAALQRSLQRAGAYSGEQHAPMMCAACSLRDVRLNKRDHKKLRGSVVRSHRKAADLHQMWIELLLHLRRS